MAAVSSNGVDPKARPELQRFKLVETTKLIARGRSQRDPAGVKVSPTGIAIVNVAGTEALAGLARAEGLDEKTYSMVFGADAAAGQVAAVAVDPDTAGATAIRRDPRKKTVTLYLADLFDQSPELRPPSARWCPIELKPDGGAGHFVLIHLNQGLQRRTTRRAHAMAPAPK